MEDDLLVVGVDLASDREVHVGDAPLERWRSLGYGGAETLVCALCYAGIDADPGTRVPLIVHGRVGGLRRSHFAHPAGQAPVGGHHPESIRHLTAKATLAEWARKQAGVVEVAVERWTPDGSRRSDVRVLFRDGREVALEVQQTPLTDDQWARRHEDYQRQGIVDAWLWLGRSMNPHWVVVEHGQLLWELDLDNNQVVLLCGAAHRRGPRWWAGENLGMYAPHLPPCVGDTITRRKTPLDSLRLTAEGLAVPDKLDRAIDDARDAVEQEASRWRTSNTRTATHRPDYRTLRRRKPSPQRRNRNRLPLPLPGPGEPACRVCGLRLDPCLVSIGHHIGC